MAGSSGLLTPIFLLLLFPLVFNQLHVQGAAPTEEVYVVYIGAKSPRHEVEVVSEHHELLASVLGSTAGAQDAILYHYHRSFQGFAAKLTSHHAQALRESEKVRSVFLSQARKLQTTHSWDFLGINSNVTGNSYQFPAFINQSDVVIGIIDSGYWPESPSFSDLNMPPVPLSWRGACVPGHSFTADVCNKKVIGAKCYYTAAATSGALQDILSPRDIDGHGSHCASVAAGSRVPDVGLYLIGNGTVTGGAPGARLAIYKVCWKPSGSCFDADVLAAFDDAIADGVQVLSVSLGSRVDEAVLTDGVGMGSFHAARQGVVVVAAGGNEGPDYSTVANAAPWIITVGASTTDREFVTNVLLGDGTLVPGRWVVNPFAYENFVPIIFGSQAAVSPSTVASYCASYSLDPARATNAIVICNYDPTIDAVDEVKRVGGLGLIYVGNPLGSQQFPLPVTVIDFAAAATVDAYVQSTASPVAKILPTQAVFDYKPAPKVAAFSSRGPSVVHPDILKPDITAPGVDILAAYSPRAVDESTAFRQEDYNILSGTSMSTPHIAGIAALIKVVHPDWSPAAIKSAIVTTAYQVDNSYLLGSTVNETITSYPSGGPGGYFDFGAGHVSPARALEPGLVYDALPDDYVSYLCSFGSYIALSAGLVCPVTIPQPFNLNYPSITLSQLLGNQTVVRTVTNVGPQGMVTYNAAVAPPYGVAVTVVPSTLQFQFVGQQLTFSVFFQVQLPSVGNTYSFGTLQWSDGIHFVTSPMVVKPTLL